MITIKFIPNLLSLKDRKVFEAEYKGCSIRQYLLDISIAPEDKRFILTGKAAELEDIPVDNDEIIAVNDIKGPMAGAMFAFAWGWTVTYVVPALMFIATAYSIYQAVTYKPPSIPTFGSEDSTPTYGWDGVQSYQSVGVPVPVVYGTHKIGGNIINAFISTNGDKNFLNVLLGICEGEVDSIDSIHVNDNPIHNFDSVSIEKRYGTNNDAVIDDFQDLHNLYSQSVDLEKDNAYVYTTANVDVEGFELHLLFPNGLYEQNTSNGSLMTWSVSYKVEYRVHGVGSYTDMGTRTVSAKSRSAVRRIFRKSGLNKNQYDIRITRTSDDSSTFRQGDLKLTNVDEIKTDDLSYPNTAKVGLKLLATGQLSGAMPNITSVVRGRKVLTPDVHDGANNPVDCEDYYWDPHAEEYRLFSDDSPCSWNGLTFVQAYSSNPIWCLKDFLLNRRFGLGEFVDASALDSDKLLEMSRYCDERVPDGRGAWEKRFKLDIVLDGLAPVPDMLQQIISAFRGIVFFSEGKVNVIIDKPSVPVQLFGMGNIIAMEQQWKSVKETPNVVEVQFLDKDKNYEMEQVAVVDEVSMAEGDPVRKNQIRVYTTNISQALREGRYALKTGKYLKRSIALKCGIDAVACQAGDVINVSHDVPQWGFSGRAPEDSDGNLDVYLADPLTIESGKTYQIQVQHPSGEWETRNITNAPGAHSQVNVSEAFTQSIVKNSLYAAGETNKTVKPFRIVSMKMASNHEVEMTAIEYNPFIYDDSAVQIPDNNYSHLSPDIPVVTDLTLAESVRLAPDGSSQVMLDVYFNKPNDSQHRNKYQGCNIYVSDDGGASYFLFGYTQATTASIPNVSIGTEYHVKVVTVTTKNIEDALSNAPTESMMITGIVSHPNNVQNFSYAFTDKIIFSWDIVPNIDLAGYEIRTEDDNWGLQNAHLVFQGSVNQFTLNNPSSREPGTFYIRAFNGVGGYSEVSASVAPVNPVPAIPVIDSLQWFGFVKIFWQDVADTDLQRYEIFKSPTNAWEGEEVLDSVAVRTSVIVHGKAPVNATADSADATSITDADLIGYEEDYFLGDVLVQTSGTHKGQDAVITAYNETTGKLTVASWPLGTPSEDDEFVIKDRAHYKVRAVDAFGPGGFSSAVTIDFTPLTEAEIGDAVISARKLIAGEVITLSAQIKDLIVTNAKIFDLHGSKITAESITLSKLASDAIPPKTYYQDEPPTVGVNNGDFWIDTDDNNKLYIYEGGVWVVVSESGGTGGGITVFRQGTIPVALSAGDLWVNTADGDKLYRATNAGDDEIKPGEWELINAATATGWAHGLDVTKIDGGQIFTNTVTADKINVAQLDALSVNTGTLNVDEKIEVGDEKVVIDGENQVIKVYDDDDNLRIELGKLED